MSRIFSAIIGSHDDKHGTNDNRKTKLNENKISKNIIIYDYSPVISFCFLFIIPVDEKDLSIFLLHPRVISSGFLALFFFFLFIFDEAFRRKVITINQTQNERSDPGSGVVQMGSAWKTLFVYTCTSGESHQTGVKRGYRCTIYTLARVP